MPVAVSGSQRKTNGVRSSDDISFSKMKGKRQRDHVDEEREKGKEDKVRKERVHAQDCERGRFTFPPPPLLIPSKKGCAGLHPPLASSSPAVSAGADGAGGGSVDVINSVELRVASAARSFAVSTADLKHVVCCGGAGPVAMRQLVIGGGDPLHTSAFLSDAAAGVGDNGGNGDAVADDPFADVLAMLSLTAPSLNKAQKRTAVVASAGKRKANVSSSHASLSAANPTRALSPSSSSSSSSSDRLHSILHLPKPFLGPSELQAVYIVTLQGRGKKKAGGLAAPKRSAMMVMRKTPAATTASLSSMDAYPTCSGGGDAISDDVWEIVRRDLVNMRRQFSSTLSSPLSPFDGSSSLNASSTLHRKVADLIHHVNNEVLHSGDDCWENGGGKEGEEEEKKSVPSVVAPSSRIITIAINALDGEIIGVCAATQQDAAARIEEVHTDDNDDGAAASASLAASSSSSSSGGIVLSNRWVKGCLCGVNLIWVHHLWQHRGLATSLIEAARTSLVYGFEVPREYVAFSYPTTEGAVLARKYSRRNDFLVFV